MAYPSVEVVPFAMPGGEACVPSQRRPIDLVHLARQTMGDRALEQEVLSMFVQQAQSVRDQIGRSNDKQRRFLAHGLKGSARGVGAFIVAELADALENDPGDKGAIGRLAEAIEDVRDFVAAISR
ncbi:histidine kinase [Nitratireductor sp. CAU 1489]|uniref:Histidine kinase n=1 Tax=Nitratireductor arenosus TaxID=2682096 RepID=A0A844QHY2_9HYPH|nr:Hpt domain-containing protein [Nitratireductor arenosus]MVA97633.1 histidine kinase [Nitratireductor arenosus]